jgi:hypothetical protein
MNSKQIKVGSKYLVRFSVCENGKVVAYTHQIFLCEKITTDKTSKGRTNTYLHMIDWHGNGMTINPRNVECEVQDHEISPTGKLLASV